MADLEEYDYDQKKKQAIIAEERTRFAEKEAKRKRKDKIYTALMIALTLALLAIITWLTRSTWYPMLDDLINPPPKMVTVEGKIEDASAYNWGDVQIANYAHWCEGELPLPESWDKAGAFTIVFKDTRVLVSITTESQRAEILLFPVGLMENFAEEFNDFILNYGDMLSLFLKGTSVSYDIINCGSTLYLYLNR